MQYGLMPVVALWLKSVSMARCRRVGMQWATAALLMGLMVRMRLTLWLGLMGLVSRVGLGVRDAFGVKAEGEGGG